MQSLCGDFIHLTKLVMSLMELSDLLKGCFNKTNTVIDGMTILLQTCVVNFVIILLQRVYIRVVRTTL